MPDPQVPIDRASALSPPAPSRPGELRAAELSTVNERLARVVVAQRDLATAVGSVEQIMGQVCLLADELTSATGAVVESVEGEWLVHRAAAGSVSHTLGLQNPRGECLSGFAVRSVRSLDSPDTEADARVDREACRRLGVRSMAVVPLLFEGDVVAVLKVVADEPDAFGDADLAVIELLGAALGSAVGRLQVARGAEALEAVTAALGGADDGEAALVAALEALGRSLDWDHVGLWTTLPDGGHVRGRAWNRPDSGYDRLEPARIGPGEGLPSAVVAAGRPLWREAGFDGLPSAQSFLALGTSIALAVPVGSVGALVCLASTARSADGATASTVAHVGSLLSQFVRRVEAERRLADEISSLGFVLQSADRMASLSSLDEVRTLLCTATAQLTGAAVVVLFERRGDRLVSVQAAGRPAPDIELDLAEHSAAWTAAESARGLFLAEVQGSSEISRRLADEDGVVSLAFQPVVRDGRAEAVLAVGWSRPIAEHDAKLDAIGLLAVEANIATDRLALLERLDHAARTDSLTGLQNRRVWDRALTEEHLRARRSGRPYAVTLVDLDRFKAYNDAHGHAGGDALLRAAAAAWAAEVRATDVLVRYGGEEFAVLLPDTNLRAAEAFAERLRTAVPGGQTCSIGVAEWDGREDPVALVARADAALYRAKDAGRNRVITALTTTPAS